MILSHLIISPDFNRSYIITTFAVLNFILLTSFKHHTMLLMIAPILISPLLLFYPLYEYNLLDSLANRNLLLFTHLIYPIPYLPHLLLSVSYFI